MIDSDIISNIKGVVMDITPTNILMVLGSVAFGWLISYIFFLLKARKYKKELSEYKEHLNRHLKLTEDGNQQREKSLEQLRKENENLKVSIKTLGQKPGRSEIRLLNIYDSAVRKMMLKAPGFSSAWEISLQESEKEYKDSERGIKTIFRKVLGPSISQKTEANKAKSDEADGDFKY